MHPEEREETGFHYLPLSPEFVERYLAEHSEDDKI